MKSIAAATAGRPLLGVLLVVLASFAFALADTLTKHLAPLYPLPVILAIRYVVNLALIALIFWPRMRSGLWRARRMVLLIVRALCLAVGSLTAGWALQVMPLGETIAIIYLSPFLVMLLAFPLLGERVPALGWVGAAVGFAGVLLVVRPGAALDPMGVLFALSNAILSTGYSLLTRLLTRTETTTSMLFHTAWVGAAIFVVLAIPSLNGFAPSAVDIGLMVLLGALMTVGHFLFTAAYREAPASLVAPVTYLHLVWAGGLGWIVFSHIPDPLSIAGMVLVAAAGAGVALNAHLQRRRSVAAAEVTPPTPPMEV
jgi:drug/metabolite transporter (DMT)-like permease